MSSPRYITYKDDKRKNPWILWKPLTWQLWLASFCSFVFIGILIWILEHRVNEDFRGTPSQQVSTTLWFAFSTMVFAHKERVVSNLSKFVLIIWFLVVLILTQSYTASLTSMLTFQLLEPTVTDVNELIRNKEYVGYETGSFVYDFLKQMGFNDSKLVTFSSVEQLDELLSKGSGHGGIAAAFHEIPYINVLLAKYCSKYTTVGPTYKTDGFGFVFPLGSPLVPDVSRAILKVRESKTMMEIERKWLRDKASCPNSTSQGLGLTSFLGLFFIIGMAGSSALIIYVIRFLRDSWKAMTRANSESTIWSKTVKLFHVFGQKDLHSHTFKNREMTDRDQQTPISLDSLSIDFPTSPVSTSTSEHNENIQADQVTHNARKNSHEEIELANL